MPRALSAAAFAIATLAISGCVVAHGPPPPRLLSPQEAVNSATYFARGRGLVVDTTLATRLDRRARWHVDLSGAGGRDRARVVVDGYSGRVLQARLRGAHGEIAPGPPVAGPPPDATPPPGSASPPEAGPPGAPPATPAPGSAPPPPESVPPPPATIPPPPGATPPR